MGKNSYEYTGINTSATAAFPAGEDLADIGATAVMLAEEGLSKPEAGAEVLGIVPVSEDESYQKGEDITVQVKDIGLWKAGAEIARGMLLATDKDGLCQEASSGQWICARALTSASEKGSLIRVQIIHAGQMAQTVSTP
ncbi:MAG: DUF2190 family protein [Lachnospiraceae bacterium]|nr:DUF2190 family protein [Lachnospiraceae bacterium]